MGPLSSDLIDLVFRLNLGRPCDDIPPRAFALASRLGWVTHRPRALTELGWLVADPIREYRLWLDRGRLINGASAYPLLAHDAYEGKSVLEPGSGFGCNLLSLVGMRGRFVGVEPVEAYRQFAPIFALREGLPVPELIDARCEALPLPDASFDVVLCYSAHQYMDVRRALREMARVLRPGGQLRLIGGTLEVFAREIGARLLKRPHPRLARDYALTVANTAAYQTFGRRLVTPRGRIATAAPIYPKREAMHRFIAEAGLALRADLTRPVHGETCFVADKPR